MTSVLDPFLAACDRHPDRPAIIDRDGNAITYAALRDEASALAAHWQRQGIAPGDTILVAHPVSIPLYRALIATWMAGCAAVFPEPFAGLRGLRHAKHLLAPRAAISNGVGRFLLRLVIGGRMKMLSPHAPRGGPQIAPMAPAPIALYSFTSGSTGIPKCIPRSHDFMLAQSTAVSRVLASPRHETDLVWFPVFVLAILANGGTAVLADSNLKRPDRPDATALARQIVRHGATRLLAPPAVALALADHPCTKKLATVFTGGGPILPHHFERIANIADEIIAIYGSTEAEPIAVLSSHDLDAADYARMREGGGILAGKPVTDIALRIIENEIQVAGPHVVETYLDPCHNAENKIAEGDAIWHRTGDGGYLDAQTRLWLRGRLKDRIGDLWPLEMESRALAIPGIRAAALVAIDGEPVLALVRDPNIRIDPDRLETLAQDAWLVFLDRIPMDRRHASKVNAIALADRIRRKARS